MQGFHGRRWGATAVFKNGKKTGEQNTGKGRQLVPRAPSETCLKGEDLSPELRKLQRKECVSKGLPKRG